MNPNPATRVFELVDPREPNLPRYVGYGAGDCPWLLRLEGQPHDGSKLGRWFRSLHSAGVAPVESYRWLPRVAFKWCEARRLARFRIRTICQWAGTWPAQPAFLLNEHIGRRAAPLPIMRIHHDGRTERFASIYAAGKANGWGFATTRFFLETGGADKAGWRYFVARG